MRGKNDTSILFSSRHWTFVSLHCEGFKNPHICCRNRLSGLNNSHLFLTILEAGELQDQGASTSGFWQGSSCGLTAVGRLPAILTWRRKEAAVSSSSSEDSNRLVGAPPYDLI